MIWYLALVALVTFLIYRRIKYSHMYQLAARVPGLSTIPIFGNAHHFLFNKDTEYIEYIRSSVNFYRNGIIKLWLGSFLIFVLGNPQDVEIILRSTNEKSSVYKLFEVCIGKSLLTTTSTLWKHERKIISPAFNKKSIQLYFDLIRERVGNLTKRIEQHCDGATFDIYEELMLTSLQNVCGSVLGLKTDELTRILPKIVTCIKHSSNAMFNRLFRIWQHTDSIFILTTKNNFKDGMEILNEFSKSIIEVNKQYLGEMPPDGDIDHGKFDITHTEPGNMQFKNMVQNLQDHQLPDQQIIDEIKLMFGSATETLSFLVSMCLINIGSDSKIQQKVVEELDMIYGTEDRPILESDLNQIQYLNYVIKESLRLYPSVPIIGRKIFEDVQLSKFTLPAGSECGIAIIHLHRDKNVWGPDAEEFNPERWRPENSGGRHTYSFMPFSRGIRNCIGLEYAMMSIKLMLIDILRKYSVSADVRQMEFYVGMSMKSKNGYPITIKKRNLVRVIK